MRRSREEEKEEGGGWREARSRVREEGEGVEEVSLDIPLEIGFHRHNENSFP